MDLIYWGTLDALPRIMISLELTVRTIGTNTVQVDVLESYTNVMQ